MRTGLSDRSSHRSLYNSMSCVFHRLLKESALFHFLTAHEYMYPQGQVRRHSNEKNSPRYIPRRRAMLCGDYTYSQFSTSSVATLRYQSSHHQSSSILILRLPFPSYFEFLSSPSPAHPTSPRSPLPLSKHPFSLPHPFLLRFSLLLTVHLSLV